MSLKFKNDFRQAKEEEEEVEDEELHFLDNLAANFGLKKKATTTTTTATAAATPLATTLA